MQWWTIRGSTGSSAGSSSCQPPVPALSTSISSPSPASSTRARKTDVSSGSSPDENDSEAAAQVLRSRLIAAGIRATIGREGRTYRLMVFEDDVGQAKLVLRD